MSLDNLVEQPQPKDNQPLKWEFRLEDSIPVYGAFTCYGRNRANKNPGAIGLAEVALFYFCHSKLGTIAVTHFPWYSANLF